MSYDFIGLVHRVAPCLFSLTETAFDLDEVEARCRGWGWTPTEVDLVPGVARFRLDNEREAVFDSGRAGGLHGRAFLWIALCYWPDDEAGLTSNVKGMSGGDGEEAGGRDDFDARFEAAYDAMTDGLGPPAARGKFEYGHEPGWPYSYAVWRGERGFVVLQQDELDIQFGLDISIWVLAGNKGEDLPSFPLSAESSTGDPTPSAWLSDPLWDRELDG